MADAVQRNKPGGIPTSQMKEIKLKNDQLKCWWHTPAIPARGRKTQKAKGSSRPEHGEHGTNRGCFLPFSPIPSALLYPN